MSGIDPISLFEGAATMVAALAWNDAVKGSIDSYFPQEKRKTAIAQILYATIITIIILIAITLYNMRGEAIEFWKELIQPSNVPSYNMLIRTRY